MPPCPDRGLRPLDYVSYCNYGFTAQHVSAMAQKAKAKNKTTRGEAPKAVGGGSPCAELAGKRKAPEEAGEGSTGRKKKKNKSSTRNLISAAEGALHPFEHDPADDCETCFQAYQVCMCVTRVHWHALCVALCGCARTHTHARTRIRARTHTLTRAHPRARAHTRTLPPSCRSLRNAWASRNRSCAYGIPTIVLARSRRTCANWALQMW